MDTTIIIPTFKSEIVFKSIRKIKKKFKIIIVENSNNLKFKNKIESKNVKVILTKKDLGYAKSLNIGIRKCKTKYLILMNPDCFIDVKSILNLEKIEKKIKKFSILVPRFNGYKENILNKVDYHLDKNLNYNFKNNIINIKYAPGSFYFMKTKNAKEMMFDEKYYLYYEDRDFCKRAGKIYLIQNINYRHLYNQSHPDRLNNIIWLVKVWHHQWSMFYYHKKNYNYVYAFRIFFSKLLRYYFRYILDILMNRKNKNLNKAKFLGLLFSFLNIDSNKGYKFEKLN